MITAFLVIKGKVQGVFYRAKAKEKADEIGLTGWVKNRSDGQVEATVSGEEKAVQKFIDWCKQGPSMAVVESVEVKYLANENFNSFKIIR